MKTRKENGGKARPPSVSYGVGGGGADEAEKSATGAFSTRHVSLGARPVRQGKAALCSLMDAFVFVLIRRSHLALSVFTGRLSIASVNTLPGNRARCRPSYGGPLIQGSAGQVQGVDNRPVVACTRCALDAAVRSSGAQSTGRNAARLPVRAR